MSKTKKIKKKTEEVIEYISPAEAEDLLGKTTDDLEREQKTLAKHRYAVFQDAYALAKEKKFSKCILLINVLMENMLRQSRAPLPTGKYAKALEDLLSQLHFAMSKNMSRHRMRNHLNFLANVLRQVDQALYPSE